MVTIYCRQVWKINVVAGLPCDVLKMASYVASTKWNPARSLIHCDDENAGEVQPFSHRQMNTLNHCSIRHACIWRHAVKKKIQIKQSKKEHTTRVWVKVLCLTRYKVGHFGDVLPVNLLANTKETKPQQWWLGSVGTLGLDQQSYSVPDLVSTGMGGDHLRAGKPIRFVICHSGQLSLLPSVGWKMSTGQSGVTLSGWGLKACMAHSICG